MPEERLKEKMAVAPCAGAWIETEVKVVIIAGSHVAPCAGAWIETAILQ